MLRPISQTFVHIILFLSHLIETKKFDLKNQTFPSINVLSFIELHVNELVRSPHCVQNEVEKHGCRLLYSLLEGVFHRSK